MYYVFLSNSFLQPILTVFNPGFYMKVAEQKYVEKQKKYLKMTQKQLNEYKNLLI